VLRTLWRLVVLSLGVWLAYLAVFDLFPFLDRRLPFFFVLLLMYIAVAYFGLPALLRTWRVFIRPNHIPLYVTTRDGLPSDPVNIAVVARSRYQFMRAMKKAGWYTADKANLQNTIREGWAMALNKPYPTAPFSRLYLFNRPADIGFQIPYGKNGSEQMVWIGAAIDDISIYGIRWFNLQVTHRTHPKHTRERDLIIDSLQKTGRVKSVSEVQAGAPFEMRSQQIGNSFISDGKLKIVELK
jgi:hypothetical protein